MMTDTPWMTLDLAARRIRQLLRERYHPELFSVRQRRGNCIDVSWTDGPSLDAVESLIGAYRSGRFDSMTDCASSVDVRCPVDGRTYRGGARFLSLSRAYSERAMTDALSIERNRWADPDLTRVLQEASVKVTTYGAHVHHPTDHRPAQLCHRRLADADLTCGRRVS